MTSHTFFKSAYVGYVISAGIGAAFLILQGCSPVGDDANVTRMVLSVPTSFSAEQVAATEDARDQWCAANGWCPAVVVGSAGKRIEIVNTVAEPAPGAPAVGARTDVRVQEIELQEWAYEDAGDKFWLIVAHEMGHLQRIAHHGTPDCTMYWEHSEPTYQLTCE